MKKILQLYVLLFCFQLQAQDFWTESIPFNVMSGYHANSISIPDENTVWISGTNLDGTGSFGLSTWGVSTDGGQSWTTGYFPVNEDLFPCDITAVSATTAYVAFYPSASNLMGGVWVTFDSGATWTQQQPSMYYSGDSFTDSIHFFDANNGVVIGDPHLQYFEIYTTSNAGANWIRVPSANIPSPLAGEWAVIGQFDAFGDTIWFGTNKNRLFRSADKGLTWSVSQLPVDNPDNILVSSARIPFAFRNQNDGLLQDFDGQLYETADGGVTWTEITNYNGAYWNGFMCHVPQTGNTYFSAGRDMNDDYFGSSYSTNDGDDWTNMVDSGNPIYPVIAKFYNSSIGYCSAYNGGYRKFYRLTDPLNRLLQNDSFSTTEAFIATPNPTSDRIKLTGPKIESVLVYDVSGKVVLGQSFDNISEVTLDLSSLQNGLYLTKVNAQDGKTSILKIVKK